MISSVASRLQRCESQLQDFLTEALRGIAPESLSQRVLPDKWSARENLAHLARYHEVFLERIDRILAESAPLFPRYRAEEDPEWPKWSDRPASDVLAELASLRARLIVKLRSLTEEDFRRTGRHPKLGEMPLALWLEFFLMHEGHHLLAVLQLVRSSPGIKK
jgi:uncharacterized damage-inducible protein DinB